MEKIFTNKSIWKKIVVAILIVMAFQMLVSVPRVYATGEHIAPVANFVFEGVLVNPVISLVMTMCDGVIGVLHSSILGQDTTLYTVQPYDADWVAVIVGLVAFGIVAAIGIAIAVASGPAGWAGLLAAAKGLLVTLVVAGGAGVATYAGANAYIRSHDSSEIPETLYLPIYNYSPEEIFKGNILLFNVDFFNNSKQLYVCYSKVHEKEVTGEQTVSGTTSGGQQIETSFDTTYTLEVEDKDIKKTVEDYDKDRENNPRK